MAVGRSWGSAVAGPTGQVAVDAVAQPLTCIPPLVSVSTRMERGLLAAAAAVAALLLGGCGGSSPTATSRSAATSTTMSAGGVAPPPGAPPALRGVVGRVLRPGELQGFSPEGRRVLGINAPSWVAEVGVPASEGAKEVARLQRLGFVAAVSEKLAPVNGGPAEALSIVEQFSSSNAARSELANQVMRSAAQGAKPFTVSGITGAQGFGGAHGRITGVNVAFATGPYYYLVGAGWPTGSPSPPTRAEVVAAAEHLYRRLYG